MKRHVRIEALLEVPGVQRGSILEKGQFIANPVPLSTVDNACMELTREVTRQRGHTGIAVETIVVYDGHRKINCYGRYIDADFLFRLNMSCMVKGTRTTCHVSYPQRAVLNPNYKKGFFVKASTLGMKTERDFYLAFVNIKVDPDPNPEKGFDQNHDFILYNISLN